MLRKIISYVKSNLYRNILIAPANKYVNAVIPAKAGYEVKLLRYPGYYWMPEQVRHDVFGYLVARLI